MRLWPILTPSPLRFAAGVLALLAALGAAPAGAAGFEVTSTEDLPDRDLRDNECRAGNGRCTLRAAVEQANYLGGQHGIGLETGTYLLKSPLRIEAMILIGGRRGGATIDCQGATTAFSVAGDLTLRDLLIQRCQGIENRGSTFLSGVRLDSNSGPIWNSRQLIVVGSTFSGNRAIRPISGAAIVNQEQGWATVFESDFERNESDTEGGAIINRGEMTVTICRFQGNSADRGGAIYNSGRLSVQLATFESNEGNDGGAIYNLHEAQVYQSSFIYNRADARGGAIWSEAPLQLVSSTVSGNLAAQGGGLYGAGEPNALYLANATVTENRALPFEGPATVAGGGLYGPAILRNSILARNKSDGSGQDCAPALGSPALSQGYNIIGIADDCGLIVDPDDQTGTLSSPFDPRLQSLDDTTWWPPFHAPSPEGPAVDRGNPNECRWPVTEKPVELDQLEKPRHWGAACDVGAVEYIG